MIVVTGNLLLQLALATVLGVLLNWLLFDRILPKNKGLPMKLTHVESTNEIVPLPKGEWMARVWSAVTEQGVPCQLLVIGVAGREEDSAQFADLCEVPSPIELPGAIGIPVISPAVENLQRWAEEEHQPLRLSLDRMFLFALFQTIGLALRHPQFPPGVRTTIEQLQRRLRDLIPEDLRGEGVGK